METSRELVMPAGPGTVHVFGQAHRHRPFLRTVVTQHHTTQPGLTQGLRFALELQAWVVSNVCRRRIKVRF